MLCRYTLRAYIRGSVVNVADLIQEISEELEDKALGTYFDPMETSLEVYFEKDDARWTPPKNIGELSIIDCSDRADILDEVIGKSEVTDLGKEDIRDYPGGGGAGSLGHGASGAGHSFGPDGVKVLPAPGKKDETPPAKGTKIPIGPGPAPKKKAVDH